VIRAFIAVLLPLPVLEKIAAARQKLQPRIPNVRWVAASNLHFTLKFLGDIEESKVAAIGDALAERLRPFPRCTINAKGLGVFPDPKRARILWVGLAGSAPIALASLVEGTLEPLGFMPEPRSLKPHLTIGRWRQSDRPPKDFADELVKWRDAEFGQFQAGEIIIIRSDLQPQGAQYHKLRSIPLGIDSTTTEVMKERRDGR
jgi:RNA 2',3'-cyclic 3'-phosphodiesterase